MVKIYCIEDINDLKYVGSTVQELQKRFNYHRSHSNCSSRKLNLNYAIIYLLEECPDEDRIEREKYWINKLDCVNEITFTFDPKKYKKEYDEKNKERLKQQRREKYLAKKLNLTPT